MKMMRDDSRNLANQIRRIHKAKEAEELGGVVSLSLVSELQAGGCWRRAKGRAHCSSPVALLLCIGGRELLLVVVEEAGA
ncbi:hypothetical protein EYF80_008130 [Liparis tanakae]|uniref:Uncharacterized protein n=1 Tax=Liparis tanakae TaxID=230148 RepID=A0A4Z2IVV7_9TELE|nr:hypothetical protein EYF80_008130 [Liparis tanakae]